MEECEVSRLKKEIERRERALSVVMDAIGKPPQGVLMYEGRERILLDAVARAEDILAGKEE